MTTTAAKGGARGRSRRPRVNDRVFQLRAPSDLWAELEKAAARERRTVSDYLRILIEDHLRQGKP